MYLLSSITSITVILFTVTQSLLVSDFTPRKAEINYFEINSLEIPVESELKSIEFQNTQAEKIIQDQKAAAQARLKALVAQKKSSLSSRPKTSAFPIDGASYERMIRQKCNEYGCSAAQVLRVMQCESGGIWNNVSPTGKYIGLFQFSRSTFYANASYMNKKNYNVWNPWHQIDVATWMFSRGQAWQWQCK